MEIYRKEIFGPVLSTVRAKTYEEALKMAMDHEYGNGTAIYTRDGDTARDFANRVNVGMIGINVPIPVPLAYHTFGGWKKSAFGDLNQHGPDSFRFYTRTKTITSRWPIGHEGGRQPELQTDGISQASPPRSGLFLLGRGVALPWRRRLGHEVQSCRPDRQRRRRRNLPSQDRHSNWPALSQIKFCIPKMVYTVP